MGDQMSSLWGQAPAVTRSTAVIPLALHLAGFAFGPYLHLALNLSLGGVMMGRVWPIFISALWEPPGSFMNTIFAFLVAFWVLCGLPDLERANGSGRLLVWMMAASIAINICFLPLAAALDFAWSVMGWMSIWPMVPCRGIMPLATCALTARCAANPEAETSFFGIRMRSKFYPLVLIGILGILNGPAILQDVAGVFIGYMHERPLKLRSRLPSDSTLTRWESRVGCIFGRRLFSGEWVRVRDSIGGSGLGGDDSGLPMRGGYTMIGRPQTSGPPVVTQFQVFGGRGQRLGD